MARCSLFVLKVPLNTKQTNKPYLVPIWALFLESWCPSWHAAGRRYRKQCRQTLCKLTMMDRTTGCLDPFRLSEVVRSTCFSLLTCRWPLTSVTVTLCYVKLHVVCCRSVDWFDGRRFCTVFTSAPTCELCLRTWTQWTVLPRVVGQYFSKLTV